MAQGTWTYAFYNQLGARGFFGPYDVDAGTTGNFATLNGWLGNRQPDLGNGVLVSGSNASWSDVALQVDPSIGNDWIRLKGRYIIDVYTAAGTQGTYVPMSPGQLTLWNLLVYTPVVNIGYGKRPFNQGLGLQFAEGRSKEYLFAERRFVVPDLLVGLVQRGSLPQGVLSWFNPSAWGRYKTSEPEDPTKKETFEMYGSYAGSAIGPAAIKIGFGLYPWERTTEPVNAMPVSWNNRDLNAARDRNLLAYLTYMSTDMRIGVGGLYASFHQGPELQQSLTARINTPTRERYFTEGWVFLQYNNGRVFLGTELDWYNRVDRFQRSLTGDFMISTGDIKSGIIDDGSGRSRFAPQYVESWRFMAEAGMQSGPTLVRLFYSWMPGPDRRHGIRIDRQPFIQDDDQAALGIFDPYSMLLSWAYGSGVDAPAHISDASVFAAKFNYAVAANVIVQLSVLKAIRNSHGYGWGYIRPNTAAGAFGTIVYADPVDPGLPSPPAPEPSPSTFRFPSPAIPNSDLGWEVTAEVGWQLLEGWAVTGRVGFWKPGKWFSYACIDKSVRNWDEPKPSNNWGTNPGREIDPVMALEVRLGATY